MKYVSTIFVIVILQCAVLALGGCASDAKMEAMGGQTIVLPRVRDVELDCSKVLDDFGPMIAAYLPTTTEIPVEIGASTNLSGAEKIVPTIFPHVVWACDRIGLPIRTQLTYANPIFLSGSNALNVPPGSEPNSRRGLPALVLDANIIAYEEMVVWESEFRGDVLLHVGAEQGDGGGSRGRKKLLTKIATSFQLRTPSGVSYAGTNATLQLWLLDDVQNHGVSLYVSGSGLGFTGRIQQNKGRLEALQTLAALSVCKSMGIALGLPVHRLSSVFADEQRHVENVTRAFTLQPRGKQFADLKQLLWTSGNEQVRIDEEGVTPADQAVIEAAARSVKADPVAPDGLAKLYINLWRQLDYRAGAKRIADRRAFVAQHANTAFQDQQLAAAREAAHYDAAQYMLAPGTAFVLVDSRGLNPGRREGVLERLASWSGCRGIVHGGTTGVDALVIDPGPAAAGSKQLLQFVRKDSVLATARLSFHFADGQRRFIVAAAP